MTGDGAQEFQHPPPKALTTMRQRFLLSSASGWRQRDPAGQAETSENPGRSHEKLGFQCFHPKSKVFHGFWRLNTRFGMVLELKNQTLGPERILLAPGMWMSLARLWSPELPRPATFSTRRLNPMHDTCRLGCTGVSFKDMLKR